VRDRDQKIKLYRDLDRDQKKNYRNRDQIKRVTGTWTGTKKKLVPHISSTDAFFCIGTCFFISGHVLKTSCLPGIRTQAQIRSGFGTNSHESRRNRRRSCAWDVSFSVGVGSWSSRPSSGSKLGFEGQEPLRLRRDLWLTLTGRCSTTYDYLVTLIEIITQ
jgi:hypothetical protein